MIHARHLSTCAFAAAVLIGGCSSTPEASTYSMKESVPVGVASTTAPATVASGLNTTTTTDRVVIDEPASQAPGTPRAP